MFHLLSLIDIDETETTIASFPKLSRQHQFIKPASLFRDEILENLFFFHRSSNFEAPQYKQLPSQHKSNN